MNYLKLIYEQTLGCLLITLKSYGKCLENNTKISFDHMNECRKSAMTVENSEDIDSRRDHFAITLKLHTHSDQIYLSLKGRTPIPNTNSTFKKHQLITLGINAKNPVTLTLATLKKL